jgi:hypothetical protein
MLPNLQRPHHRRILLRGALAAAVLAANPKWLHAQPAVTPLQHHELHVAPLTLAAAARQQLIADAVSTRAAP